MKRSILAQWMLLAAAAVGVFLLVDPFGWLGTRRAAEGVASPTPMSEGVANDAELAPAPQSEESPVAPTPVHGEADVRQAVDPAAVAARVSFRLVASADRPVVGAQVLVVRGAELLGNERTNEQGEVEFAADAAPAELFIAVARRPLERRDVVLAAGRQELVLADGARVSGRFVRDDDGGAVGKLRINVESDGAVSSIASVPAAVEQALTVMPLKNYASLDTDADGAFELSGLPASWSGRLWVPGGWKVVSTSQGELEPFARGVRLARPTSDVVMRIAPPRTLYGRLVLRENSAPLAGARVSALLRSPDTDSRTGMSATTDAEGRFELQLQQERLGSFELHLGGPSRGSPALLALAGADLPADGDLGDVLVDDVRNVPFLLQAPGGKPVAGGVALAGVARSAPTGKDGRGELRWLGRAVKRMAVQAAGFAPAEVELPPVIAAPLVVTLEPANELVVKLALPAGADPGQFKVILRGDERITAVPITQDLGDRAHVSEWAYPPVDLMRAVAGTYLCARPSAPEARVAFSALRPGIAIALEVQGITGDALYHRESLAPFAPTEHREITVALADSMIVFRGRVLGPDGTPLVRASLQLTNQILGWTNEQGAFLCFLDAPRTGTLLVSHRSCATKYLHDYVVPTDGVPVEFRLSAARRVTVEVVDERGSPMPQAEVWVEYGGFTTNTQRLEGHRHVIASAPEAPFVLLASLAGRDYRQEHDPMAPEARIVVPVHGRVTALVSAATTASHAGGFTLYLAPPKDDAAQPLSETRPSAPDLRIELSAVHPGTYQASLRYVPSEDERKAGRAADSSAPVPIVVEAGRETVIHLALPAGG